jgi:hypothetical protein
MKKGVSHLFDAYFTPAQKISNGMLFFLGFILDPNQAGFVPALFKPGIKFEFTAKSPNIGCKKVTPF